MKYILPDWPAPSCVKACTTVKTSWGEKCAAEEKATLALIDLLNLPQPPIWLTQIHGNNAIKAIPANINQCADASYTSEPNQVCAVMTADCLPILITSKDGNHIAALHAGWKGLAAGIIENTLQKLNCPIQDLMAWFGPAIGPKKFEVGADVVDAFVSQEISFLPAFAPSQQGKWLANLYQLARIRLQQLGVKQIYGGQFCTYTQADLFYSYRRDNGQTGRMATLIWIQEKNLK